MNPNLRTRPTLHAGSGRRAQAAGFTLVELLVAVTIGMALVLAITLMLTRYEGGRRSLTGQNAASMGGAYVSYTLDRLVRSAGSGYSQSWRDAYGCRLLAARGGTAVLPRPSAFPAPFAAVPQAVRLAPVVVHAGAGTDGSDVIAFATGSSGLGEAALPMLTGSATAAGLRVPATIGLRASDLVLVFESRATDCMVQQVAAGFAGGADQQLDFGGTYASASIDGVTLATLGGTTRGWVTPLGNITGSQPQFQLVGVGANATLVALDVLQLDGAGAVQALADGVADLRARYGIDTNGDDVIDSWEDPAVGDWRASKLLDGSQPARERLRQIIALRVGVIVRTNTPERDTVAPATVTLFSDLTPSTLEVTRTLTAAERLLRWRALEFTVPLRNVRLAP